jgi:hypothetical protein
MPDDQRVPRSEAVRQTETEDYLLTHVLWHNGYGACPETGVRSVFNGEVRNDFHLIQHGVRDFVWAEYFILKALRKGWDTVRIAEFVEQLCERKRPKAVFL